MKESIHIKKMGPIRDVKIDDIKPFTIFIGESASGKSTLLKIFALFRYLYKLSVTRSYLKNANITGTISRIHSETLLKNCGIEDMVESNTEIIYTVTMNNNEYTITFKNKKLQALPLIKDSDLNFFKVSFISENRNMIATWAERSAVNKGAKLGFYFHETFNDFEEATENIKELSLEPLRLRFEVKRIQNRKRYFISPLDQSYTHVDLRKSSSGIQNTTPMLAISKFMSTHFSFKDAFKRSVFDFLYENDRLSQFKANTELTDIDKWVHIHIEEPELSLYPNAQRGVINALIIDSFIKNADDRSLSLTMATHSPYIMNHLNVLLKAYYSNKPDARKGAFLNPEMVGAFKVENGTIIDLMAVDKRTNETVINTVDLSEPMDDILTDYKYLSNE